MGVGREGEVFRRFRVLAVGALEMLGGFRGSGFWRFLVEGFLLSYRLGFSLLY